MFDDDDDDDDDDDGDDDDGDDADVDVDVNDLNDMYPWDVTLPDRLWKIHL